MYIVPALIVLVTAYMLLKRFLDNDYRIRLLSARSTMQKDILPLRFQAYERLCLLLERISPNNLVIRISSAGLTSRELHSMLIQAVRDEYEHNLSQQVYVSTQAWMMVKNAKEEVIRIINTASTKVDENAPSLELSRTIINMMINNEKMMAMRALEFLKQEVRELF